MIKAPPPPIEIDIPPGLDAEDDSAEAVGRWPLLANR